MKPLTSLGPLLAVLGLLIVPSGAVADEALFPLEPAWMAVDGTSCTPKPATVLPAAGLWAHLDPETGELTDTPSDKQRALQASDLSPLNQSSEGLETFVLEGGGTGVNLQGRFMNALVVHRNADGTMEYRCLDHPDQAAGHSHEAPAAPEM